MDIILQLNKVYCTLVKKIEEFQKKNSWIKLFKDRFCWFLFLYR